MTKKEFPQSEMDRIIAMKPFSDEELKAELKRRQTVERARRHVSSAEERLRQAKDRYDTYVRALKQEAEFEQKAGRRVQARD